MTSTEYTRYLAAVKRLALAVASGKSTRTIARLERELERIAPADRYCGERD